MKDLLDYSLRMLKRRPVRTFLTAFQVALGIWAVSLILSANMNVREQIHEATARYGRDVVRVRAGMEEMLEDGSIRVRDQNVFSLEDLSDLKTSANISRAYMVHDLGLSVRILMEDTTYQLRGLLGATPDYPAVSGLTILYGDMFTPMDVEQGNPVMLISQSVARQVFKGESALGKTLTLGSGVPEGSVYRMRSTQGTQKEFEIIGVFQDMNSLQTSFLDPSHGIIPLGSMVPTIQGRNTEQIRGMVGTRGQGAEAGGRFLPTGSAPASSYSTLVIQSTPHQVHAARQDAQVILNRVLGENEELFFTYVAESNAQLFSAVNRVLYFFLAFAFIALFISSVGILSVMMISVVERTRSIGLHRALGASKGWISLQFLMESVLVSLLGAVFGLVAAYLSANYVLADLLYRAFFADLLPLGNALLHPLAVVLALSCSLISGVLFGYVPAREGAHLSPIDALRQG